MSRYKIRYYYLATGMEGQADDFTLGVIESDSPERAIDVAIDVYFRDVEDRDRHFLRGCLSAEEVK